MDFDPAVTWAAVSAPALILKGGRDDRSPADVAEREIRLAYAAGGELTFLVYAKADHLLLEWPLGAHVPPPLFAAGYLDDLRDWILDRS